MHYLAKSGASVADVIPSVNGKLVETVDDDGAAVFISLFEYAKGMLFSIISTQSSKATNQKTQFPTTF